MKRRLPKQDNIKDSQSLFNNDNSNGENALILCNNDVFTNIIKFFETYDLWMIKNVSKNFRALVSSHAIANKINFFPVYNIYSPKSFDKKNLDYGSFKDSFVIEQDQNDEQITKTFSLLAYYDIIFTTDMFKVTDSKLHKFEIITENYRFTDFVNEIRTLKYDLYPLNLKKSFANSLIYGLPSGFKNVTPNVRMAYNFIIIELDSPPITIKNRVDHVLQTALLSNYNLLCIESLSICIVKKQHEHIYLIIQLNSKNSH